MQKVPFKQSIAVENKDNDQHIHIPMHNWYPCCRFCCEMVPRFFLQFAIFLSILLRYFMVFFCHAHLFVYVPLQFIPREYCNMCLNFVSKYLPLIHVFIRYFFFFHTFLLRREAKNCIAKYRGDAKKLTRARYYAQTSGGECGEGKNQFACFWFKK